MFSDVGIPTFWQRKHFTVPEALHALHLSLMNLLCSIRVLPKAAGWKKKMSSGINAVPVEFASSIREKGIPVVGISSDNYLSQAPHNTASKHLQEVCDVCIDNAVPHGDACLQPEGLPIKMTPVSTVASTYIINSILAEGTQMALNEGICVPIYLSGNIPGGAEYNQSLIERYQKRIKCL